MAANLVRRYPRQEATDLLNSSFAQFRTDRDLVRLEATLTRRRRALEGYETAAKCERGDVGEYRQLVSTASAGERSYREEQADRLRAGLTKARPGDVLSFDGRRGRFTGVVVARGSNRAGAPQLMVVRSDGRADPLSV